MRNGLARARGWRRGTTMRSWLLLLAATGLLLATSPSAAACTDGSCVPQPVEVCSALLRMCAALDPDNLVDRTAIERFVQDLIGPCTCPPVQ